MPSVVSPLASQSPARYTHTLLLHQARPPVKQLRRKPGSYLITFLSHDVTRQLQPIV